MEGDPGFSHAPETELKDRKILKIRSKKDEEETIESAEETAVATSAKEAEIKEDTRSKKERRREWAEGKARQWKSYYHNLSRERNGREDYS